MRCRYCRTQTPNSATQSLPLMLGDEVSPVQVLLFLYGPRFVTFRQAGKYLPQTHCYCSNQIRFAKTIKNICTKCVCPHTFGHIECNLTCLTGNPEAQTIHQSLSNFSQRCITDISLHL